MDIELGLLSDQKVQNKNITSTKLKHLRLVDWQEKHKTYLHIIIKSSIRFHILFYLRHCFTSICLKYVALLEERSL